jgi:hypothetical protein
MDKKIKELLITNRQPDNNCKSSSNNVSLTFIGALKLKGSDEGRGDLSAFPS